MSFSDWFRRAPAKACSQCGTPLPDIARFCLLCGQPIEAGAAPATPTPAEPVKATGDTEVAAKVRQRLSKSLKGRYVVRELLGTGGMGMVFRADDVSLHRAVAIKVLPPELAKDANVVARFKREARTAAGLDHPGIIPVLAVESRDDLHFFVMKYVPGVTLESAMRARSQLPITFVARVLAETADALGYAHRHHIVHRDVKPSNIMLDASERVIVTDFGISKVSMTATNATTEPRLTDLGMVVGTAHYMSPEQAIGQAVDGRADQYSLAVVGFEMLAGRLPFDDITPHAIIQHHINSAPPDLRRLRPDAPTHVIMAIVRAMMKAPSNRFASMEEFAAALGGGVLGQAARMSTEFSIPAAVERETLPITPPRGSASGRGWRLATTVALALLGAGAVAAWAKSSRETATATPPAAAESTSQPRSRPR